MKRRSFLASAGAVGIPAALAQSSSTIQGTQASPVSPVDSSTLSEALAQSGPGRGAGLVAWVRRKAGAMARTVSDVLDDTPSVMDFVPFAERARVREGSSRTDLSSFFRAAAASDLPMVVPAGTYRLGDDVRFTQPVRFMPGARIQRAGGRLDFAGGIDASPGRQVFFGYDSASIAIDPKATPEGWVDWFGTDADAIETCHRIFHVARLGPRDYTVSRTVMLDRSHRMVVGSRGSAEGAGGTRIILAGPATASSPVVQLGTGERSKVLSCARRLNVSGINTVRDGAIRPASSGRREDAAPGWNISGWYESRIEDCFDFGSPIHYKVDATVACMMLRCSGVRPKAGGGGAPDFYTAFCIGGHSPSFGFIGANASLSVEGCGTAGGSAGDASRVGMYLYGYIGDTWVEKFEMSQLEFGIYVDGADRQGRTIGAYSAHQDVRVNDCILDAVQTACLTFRNLNEGAGVQVRGNYGAVAGGGDGIVVENCAGMVTIDGGDFISGKRGGTRGVRITRSSGVQVRGLACRDFEVGISAENSKLLHLTPLVRRSGGGGRSAVELKGVGQSTVAPMVSGPKGAWNAGVTLDAATSDSAFGLTGVSDDAVEGQGGARKLVDPAGPVTAQRFGRSNLRAGLVE